jgi:PspA associated protein B
VGLGDVLFGRKKLKPAAREKLFALTTAAVTLDVEIGLRTAGVAAVVFKSMSSSDFVRAENEIQQLLDAVVADSGARLDRKEDSFGFEWIVVHDNDLEDQVTAVHAVASELVARGFGEQLLAAVFSFDGGKHPVYWIYSFKRGTFWPFVPTGEEQERDNAEELELKAKLDGELPIEQDLSRWFALFDAPI